MIGVLIDSDILIEILRGKNPQVSCQFEALLSATSAVCCSAISRTEIGQGARPGEFDAITALFSFLTCIPADCKTADQAGDTLRQFRKSHSVGLGDAIIAATAVHHNLELWTRNRKHYPDPRLRFFETVNV
jgi:predicted nucleic acid-binding protein